MESKSKSTTESPRQWLTWRKVVCIGLLLLAAGYIYFRPALEKQFGISLPALTDERADNGDSGGDRTADSGNRANDNRNSSTSDRSTGTGTSSLDDPSNDFQLQDIGRGQKKSPAGLVYGMGPGGEHRIAHIMRHGKDDPNRPVHGVFDGDQNEVLQLIDDAYELIKSKSKKVQSEREGDRMEYSISMDRRIGYIGGQKGKRTKYPASDRLRLILEDDRVITAYPY